MVKRCAAALLAVLWLGGAEASGDPITLASTTSTENSGLFDYILPRFTADTGIDVRVIAVGTGQALRLGEKGDADVLLVHHPESEERFIARGLGTRRLPVMQNDFVIVGPGSDPAETSGASQAAEALARIAAGRHLFASRGDESGTHRAERALWAVAGITPHPATDRWYRELGAGMGATLNGAVALGAYVLTDRATWLGFANKRGHRVLFQGDPQLINRYSVILVNPMRHPHIRAQEAEIFAQWLTSQPGQTLIASFRIHKTRAFEPVSR